MSHRVLPSAPFLGAASEAFQRGRLDPRCPSFRPGPGPFLLVLALCLFLPASGNPQESVALFTDRSFWEKGLEEILHLRPGKAAEGWIQKAETWDPHQGRKQTVRSAWSYVLATLAFRQANLRSAYQTWPLAVSRFHSAGTTWQAERLRFHSWLERTPRGHHEGPRLLQELLDLTSFNGPPPGLGSNAWGEAPQPLPLVVPPEIQRRVLFGSEVEASERERRRTSQRSISPLEPPGGTRLEAMDSSFEAALSRGLEVAPVPGSSDGVPGPKESSLEDQGFRRGIAPKEPPAGDAFPGSMEKLAFTPAELHLSPLATPDEPRALEPLPIPSPPQARRPKEDDPADRVPTSMSGLDPLAARDRLNADGTEGSTVEGTVRDAGGLLHLARFDEEGPFWQDTALPLKAFEIPKLETTSLAPEALGTSILSTEDLMLARDAWQYLLRNRQPSGLVNSVEGYPYTTLWDVGSTFAAIHGARGIGILDEDTALSWLEDLLRTLQVIPLYQGELPNREYRTDDATIATTGRRRFAAGSGWSALDLGRLLIWFRIVVTEYPSLKELVRLTVDLWNFGRLTQDSQMNGIRFDGRQEYLRQEGRLGYEQYCAAGFALWGMDLTSARDYDRVASREMDGLAVTFDTRNLPFLTSDPFVLGLIELGGVDENFEALASTLFEVQRRRWQVEEKITAAGEDAIDRFPWFTYNNVLYEGHTWHSVSHRGKARPDLFGWSSKNAMGWWAIDFDSAYGRVLRSEVEALRRPNFGVYAGQLDNGSVNRSLNINTNAVILEALLYVHRGRRPFLQIQGGFVYDEP